MIEITTGVFMIDTKKVEIETFKQFFVLFLIFDLPFGTPRNKIVPMKSFVKSLRTNVYPRNLSLKVSFEQISPKKIFRWVSENNTI